MPILSQPAFGPKLSIGFITGGSLLDVWTLVWRYTIAPPELSPNQRFWFFGLLLTGATFIIIGAFLGSIGRAARKAELPPTEKTTDQEAKVQENLAEKTPPAPAMPMMNPMMPMGAPGYPMGMAPGMGYPPVAQPAPQPGQPAPPSPQVRPAM